MAGKRERKERRTGRRAAAVAVVAAAVAVLLAPGIPAVSVPEGPPPDPAWREPVRVLAPASLSAALPAEPETRAEPAPRPVEVPESDPVEDDYFADAAFLGDSRTEGFHLYSGLGEGTYFFAVGATVESVFTKPVWKTEAEKVPLLDALAAGEYGKIYVMLGVNELGWPKTEQFYEQYGKLIDRLLEDHPEAEVLLQSILPVSAKQEAKKTYVNNARIDVYNALIRQLAEERGCPYLDVASAVAGEGGCLRAELTFDGVHLNTEGCQVWLRFLRTHTPSAPDD